MIYSRGWFNTRRTSTATDGGGSEQQQCCGRATTCSQNYTRTYSFDERSASGLLI
ncbi:hypothetical protein [Treponema medium]|uniref:hypothetical protein n=1 Tax=Treponema medium TaxID=58231 RepID=UPI0003AB2450|nr:hypothetical protein [Treponema medium]